MSTIYAHFYLCPLLRSRQRDRPIVEDGVQLGHVDYREVLLREAIPSVLIAYRYESAATPRIDWVPAMRFSLRNPARSSTFQDASFLVSTVAEIRWRPQLLESQPNHLRERFGGITTALVVGVEAEPDGSPSRDRRREFQSG